jgi:tetratricopeptide (TPR) repeat protein
LFEQAVAINPADAQSLLLAAGNHQVLGNLAAAIAHYENAFPILKAHRESGSDPRNEWATKTSPDHHYNTAIVHHQLEHTAEANFHFLEALSINPKHEKSREAVDTLGLGKEAASEEDLAKEIGGERKREFASVQDPDSSEEQLLSENEMDDL